MLFYLLSALLTCVSSTASRGYELSADGNLTLTRKLTSRSATKFSISCKLFGQDEKYTLELERTTEDVFNFELWYDYGEYEYKVLGSSYSTAKFFNGRDSYRKMKTTSELKAEDLAGCKNCNLISLFFKYMSKWKSTGEPVTFAVFISQMKCPESYWTNGYDCLKNRRTRSYCYFSDHPISLYAVSQTATED